MATIGRVAVDNGTDVIVEALQDGNDVVVTMRVVDNQTGTTKTGWADLRGLFFKMGGDQGSFQQDESAPYEFSFTKTDSTSQISTSITSTVSGGEVREVQAGEELVVDLGNGANMQGDGRTAFDVGIEIGTGGLSDQGVADDFAETTFRISNISLADLYGNDFGVRLMSVADGTTTDGTLVREGSLKLVGVFEEEKTDSYSGLSHGYWKTHGPNAPGGQINDWDNITGRPDVYTGTNGQEVATSFEELFLGKEDDDLVWQTTGGKEPTSTNEISLLDALQLPGGGKNVLAREATAALLNARDEDVNYRYDEDQIIEWTKAALLGKVELIDTDQNNAQDWATQADAINGLSNLFETQNNIGVM